FPVSAFLLVLPPFPRRRSSDLSTTNCASSKKAGVSGSTGPAHSAACSFASPRNDSKLPNKASRTGQPCCCNRRATTKPSPPLLRSEEHTSELQSRENLVCRRLL